MIFASGKRARLWLAMLVLAASSWVGLQDGFAIPTVPISESGPLDLKFEGHSIPRDPTASYVLAKLKTSGQETTTGSQRYEVTFAGWTPKVNRQCSSGHIRLRYWAIGPMYKNLKTGQVKNPEAQLLSSMAVFMANTEGTEEYVQFIEDHYSSSRNELRVEGMITVPMCQIRVDSNHVPVCQIAWDDKAIVECDSNQ